MNLPIDPSNSIQVLVQLLSFLNKNSGLTTGAAPKELPPTLKEAIKLLFIPPAGKISLDSDLKIIPMLHSFQKKLEKVFDEVQAPKHPAQNEESEIFQSGGKPVKIPRTGRPGEPAALPSKKEPIEGDGVKKLVDEVKSALRTIPPSSAAPRENPLVKEATERMIPLLDRLAASLQAPLYQAKSKALLNPPKPEAKDLGEAPKKTPEPSLEKQPPTQDLQRESVNQVSRQIREPNHTSGKPATAERSSPNQSGRAAEPPSAPKTAPQARDFIPLLREEPALPLRSAAETHNAPFPLPFFAQASLSSSVSAKRKKKPEEDEEREERDSEKEEED